MRPIFRNDSYIRNLRNVIYDHKTAGRLLFLNPSSFSSSSSSSSHAVLLTEPSDLGLSLRCAVALHFTPSIFTTCAGLSLSLALDMEQRPRSDSARLSLSEAEDEVSFTPVSLNRQSTLVEGDSDQIPFSLFQDWVVFLYPFFFFSFFLTQFLAG